MKRALLISLLIAPALGAQDKDEATRLRDSYRRVIAAFRAELQSPDARPWDVKARAEALGSDPDAMLRYVRALRLEPYPGIQRGPGGVLASGGGNPADKAFLLAELLRARGHAARVVRGQLTPPQAQAVAGAALAAAKAGPLEKPQGPFGNPKANLDRVKAVCADAGLSAEEVVKVLQAQDLNGRDRWNEVLDVTDREIRFLHEQFKPLENSKARDLHPEIVGWLQTHYWVQAKPAGKEEWTDLDPSFPGDKGAGVPGEEVDPAAISDLFKIRLILERKVEGQPAPVDLLDWDIRVHETLLKPVRFLITPETGMEKLFQLQKPTEAQVRDTLRSFTRFQANLMVGSEAIGSDGFDLDGRVFKISKNGTFMGSTAADKVGAATLLFGDKPKEGKKTELVSLRVRYSVLREGKELWGRERVILEEGAKETWCPMLAWSFLLQSQPFSSKFATGLAMWQAVKNQGFTERVVAASGTSRNRPPDDLGAPAFVYPFPLLTFAQSRQEFLQSRAGEKPLATIRESAELFLMGSQVRLNRGGGLCLCEGFDLVEDGALVLGTDGDRFALRRDETLALGAFDTVLEQVLLRHANPSEATVGTLATFERARLLGEASRLLNAEDSAGLKESGLRESDAAWVAAHARPGERALVTPGRGSAWWSYEPATGRTVGRIIGGRGGVETAQDSQPGYVIVLNNAKNWIGYIACFASVTHKIMTGGTPDLVDNLLIGACLASATVGFGVGGGPGMTALANVLNIITSLTGFFH